ncbi:MAG: hypothetical protein R3358_09825 [Woeseiaceae bacterium]|nr:hypothetical protein [Woeseiaceae bacterium]
MSTPTDRDNEQFAEQAKALFDDSVERLDAATLSKLNRGRQAALDELADTSPAKQWLRWAPATGIAAAAVIAIMVLRGPLVDEVPPQATVSDLEILLDEDSLEMFEELEFYSWIDAAVEDELDNVG